MIRGDKTVKRTISIIFIILMIVSACNVEKYPEAAMNRESLQTGDSENSATSGVFKSQKESQMIEESQNAIGALSPEDALDYMKKTENLVIIDVAAAKWYNKNHFVGAINIPIEELNSEEEDAFYMDIPTDRPVLMHCRLGMIVPEAYERMRELRPDVPEISYIDGSPLFDDYNVWLSKQ